MSQFYRLIVSCKDRPGLVAAVSSFISNAGGMITDASQYSDLDTGNFYMRYEIDAASVGHDYAALKAGFSLIANEFDMNWQLVDTGRKKRVVLMASKGAHCLSDVLYRWRSGEMAFDIPCVISNHEDLRDYVEFHDIPYFHVPVDKDNKQAHFDEVDRLIREQDADAIVLARYMQILPEGICDSYSGKIINIHHSFLPSFVGARPYHQAHERGVKLIGATCHYVTRDLDAGPIIEQDITRIKHHHSPEDMVRLGKDVEKMVLARGLRYHLEDRVLLDGNKTIVFV